MNDEIPWLERNSEQALEPDLVICDPHHHLWVHPGNRYLVEEFLDDIKGGHRIAKTVYVECLQHYYSEGEQNLRCVGETANVHAMTEHTQATNSQVAAGIVAFADLTLGEDVAPVLDAHIAASGRLRGIRHASAWHASDKIHNAHTKPSSDLLQDPGFLKGLACLQERQLSFDAWCFFTQIPELTAVAKAFPELNIVLNHIGGTVGIGPYKGQREQVLQQWKKHIAELALCRNVSVKLGGITMTMTGFDWHKRQVPPASTDLAEAMAPYFHHCIEHFGADRCMFESNFPVDKACCSYTTQWNAFKRVSSDYSASQRAALFHDTASRVYRL